MGGDGVEGVDGLLALGQPVRTRAIETIAAAGARRLVSLPPRLQSVEFVSSQGLPIAAVACVRSVPGPPGALVGIAPPYIFDQYRLAVFEPRPVL